MTRAQRLQLYARTPVWLWPFLFLQLRALKAWHLASGHAEILVGMTTDYRLVVLCHSDAPAPAAPHAWPAPRIPAWDLPRLREAWLSGLARQLWAALSGPAARPDSPCAQPARRDSS